MGNYRKLPELFRLVNYCNLSIYTYLYGYIYIWQHIHHCNTFVNILDPGCIVPRQERTFEVLGINQFMNLYLHSLYMYTYYTYIYSYINTVPPPKKEHKGITMLEMCCFSESWGYVIYICRETELIVGTCQNIKS